MAKIFELPVNQERMCILGIREGVVQPFVASQWTDLRIGMFLSLTADDDDDDQTNLVETLIGNDLPPADRHWIGLKSQSQTLPFESGTPFIGFTNTDPAPTSHTIGGMLVQSTNGNVQSSAGNYWRSTNSNPAANKGTFGIYDGSGRLAAASSPVTNSLDQHFFKTAVPAGSGNYATLLAFRLTRSNPDSHHITVQVPHMYSGVANAHAADLLVTNDPSQDVLDVALQSWQLGQPPNAMSFGPVTMSVIPNSFFCYWPYRQSRLRIHCWGMFKNN